MSESVEKILLAPIQIEFTDNVKKIRQNLMITSFILTHLNTIKS